MRMNNKTFAAYMVLIIFIITILNLVGFIDLSRYYKNQSELGSEVSKIVNGEDDTLKQYISKDIKDLFKNIIPGELTSVLPNGNVKIKLEDENFSREMNLIGVKLNSDSVLNFYLNKKVYVEFGIKEDKDSIFNVYLWEELPESDFDLNDPELENKSDYGLTNNKLFIVGSNNLDKMINLQILRNNNGSFERDDLNSRYNLYLSGF